MRINIGNCIGSDGKESACNEGDLGSISGLGRSPGGRHGKPLQYSCLENPHGQKSLEGYSPWSHKESDMTEQLGTAQHMASPLTMAVLLLCAHSLLDQSLLHLYPTHMTVPSS